MSAAQLFTIGASHQTAPLALRERLAIPSARWREALGDLARRCPVREAALVSTCNRTEIYCRTDSPAAVREWLTGGDSPAPHLYTLGEREAVRHIFRVAGGLDSMMLGEPEITGQLKQAFAAARRAGTLRTVLHRLFEHSFSAAKQVRTETAVARESLSFASLIVKLARDIFPDLAESSALFVGAGEMCESGLAHFRGRNMKNLAVASRSRARILARRFGARPLELESLADSIAEFDIVVAAAASELPLIGKGMIERAIKRRKHRPMLIVDLAVPRNVESEVGKLDDVFLCTIDRLGEIAAESRRTRESAVAEAEAIIDAHVEKFCEWLQARTRAPLVSAVRARADSVRQRELEIALAKIRTGGDPEKIMAELSRRLANKLLHPPMAALARSGDDSAIADILRDAYLSKNDDDELLISGEKPNGEN